MVDAATIVSLIVAIIAFIVSIGQALQQYISTAEGYRKCAESVVGPWVKYRKRIFNASELRFAVNFKTPVFFVARPSNDRGPIAGKPINVDGTDISRADTLTWTPKNDKALDPTKEPSRLNYRLSTADDERATWVTLLAQLQKSEQDSRKWDEEQRLRAPPKQSQSAVPDYSMIVQLQGRNRNWDFMPESVLRPYATSTTSHIAEMCVMLGLSWVTFDVDNANLQASGNGFALSSSIVQGFGIVVSFHVVGRSEFGRNRIIPSYDIKDILFGTVPIIFRDPSIRGEEADTRKTLNFGDDTGIRRTMKYLKLRQTSIRKYSQVEKNIRSADFDLIAMLGDVFRLRGSNFRMLPNPTRTPWIDTFSACSLMTEFQENVRKFEDQGYPTAQTNFIRGKWKENLADVWKTNERDIDIEMREAVHDVIDSCTKYLVGECGEGAVISVVNAHVTVILDELDNPDSVLSTLESDSEEALMEHYFDKIRKEVMEHISSQDSISPTMRRPSAIRTMVPPQGIWLILMFRLCCWWVLHEFDQTDTRVLDPRWKGSRLPVMIL
ncbi:hypothetical protein PRZ48_012220 [Zasmidium cellare]|uniref:Modin n=1 Tax=Zasmidium cellare TaxID=395010 RepID=A0ABR0E4Q9_ZASCE|nr:hypothetical protein PRZ48_012220 [Zasmidium cellare]